MKVRIMCLRSDVENECFISQLKETGLKWFIDMLFNFRSRVKCATKSKLFDTGSNLTNCCENVFCCGPGEELSFVRMEVS